ncbi:MAG: hypothetical protein QCI82_07960 [Candidatus Thermoplasmatota archaeon]|nr:hypothetical protein [Candidatus Thermoplasmatota archaeon]
MTPANRLLIALSIWMAICLVFVNSLEVFFVLVLLGILVIREMTDSFMPDPVKDRVNFFIYTFLFIFSLIVMRKVYVILSP